MVENMSAESRHFLEEEIKDTLVEGADLYDIYCAVSNLGDLYEPDSAEMKYYLELAHKLAGEDHPDLQTESANFYEYDFNLSGVRDAVKV